ncbi:hypothetical protein F4553_007865 [Allocatelliglobosispora scoriae]|uniref:XRE family transcriptional regulator n=2 Tax=Allocatelliglobosispora scoriae TaxID=643052 RepID=A0A841C6M2_9ACTN|nr:hypothetical protein [Allocatelliglobosispora scoriae]
MSRRVLAALVGRSEEWLRQVELGTRRLDSISVAMQLVEALRFDQLDDLVDPRESAGPDDRRSTALTDEARAGYALPASLRSPYAGAATTAESLARDVAELRDTWWHASDRVAVCQHRLPQVIAAAQAGVRDDPGDEPTAAATVDALCLARSYLVYVGDRRQALVLAERAVTLAETASPASTVVAARALAMSYLQNREFHLALSIATAAADRAGDRLPVLRGSLLSVAAKAASSLGEDERADVLIKQVRQAAAALGSARQQRGVWFGPSDVTLTEMTVAWTGGRREELPELALAAPPDSEMPQNLRIPYYAMIAALCARRRDEGTAVLQLLAIQRLSAEALRYDRMVHTALRDLLRTRHPVLYREIEQLGRLAGLL